MRSLELLRKIPRPRLVATLAVLFAVYLALGFFVLPRYLVRVIPEQVTELLKRKAILGEVHVNPLLLSVELRDFSLAESDGAPLVEFRRLLVDFEASSLLRWAWTFSTITLEGLEVRAEIAPDGSFNLAELADGLPKGEAAPPGAKPSPPPRLLLQHLALVDAAVLFSDRSGARPAVASLRPLSIELRDLSTIPDRRGPYNVAARLPGGATLAWRGEISLEPIFSLGEISVRNTRPGAFWRFFEDEVKMAEPQGSVELGLRYRAAYTDGTPELTVEDIRFTASDLALTERGAKEPFFELKAAALTGGRFELARRELHLPSIELRGGVVRVEADADGVLNLQKLMVAPPPAQAAPPAPAPAPARAARPQAKPWRVKLDSIRLGELALQFRDLSRARPAAFGIGAVDVGLSAALETGAGDTQVKVDNLAVTLSRVTLGEAAAGEPLIQLATIGLQGGSFDLREQSVAVQRVALTGGTIKVAREADGSLRLLELLRGGERTHQPKESKVEKKPWRFALDAFDVQGLKIALAGHGFGQPLAYDIDPVTIALKNLSTDGKAPVRLDAALRVAQGGMLRVSGDASLSKGTLARAAARVSLERLNLKPLQPVVASRTTLALESGEVSAKLEARYRAIKGGAEVRGGGSASVDNLLLNEAGSGERFLEWKSVTVDGIQLSLAPDRLAIGDITLGGFGAKVLVNKDRSVNLVQAFKPAGTPAPQPAPVAAGDAPATFPVSIERVRMDRATVDFSDLSLILPFAAKIQELQGGVLGISTDRASRAVVKMEGRVDEFGLARIDGSLATHDPKSFLDLRVDFRNVEMSPLSAYSVTFAGRRIAGGRLALDLQYKIDQGQLAGENKVELQNFTLGERVEAPGALSLPLDLAVALLTDSEGRITVAVPVKGDVNDPQFSYGHLVWQAITTVISNIVSAPFRALFGGGGENVDSIAFDTGRAALLPPEREKLKRVAEALGKRPQLKLVVEGQHSDADRAALRQRDVARAIATALERPISGDEPPPVNVREARTQQAMEVLFVERNSEAALEELIVETGKTRGKPVDRVSPLTGRASADPYYDALLNRLNETAPLPADALDKLAAARAGVVAEHLEKTLSVPPGRMERKPPASGEGERAKLDLDVVKP